MEIGKSLLESINQLPEIIVPLIIMDSPNNPITIYEGEYTVKKDNVNLKIDGIIKYVWFPNPVAHFYGKSKADLDNLPSFPLREKILIIIDGLEFGQGYISRTSFGHTHDYVDIEGIMSGIAILGDKSIPVDKLTFSIPNLRDFRGRGVKMNNTSFRNRLVFENENFIITIDKTFDYNERNKLLEENGGYNILYTGELKSKKGSILFSTSSDIFQCLNTFITFVNGRRTSAIFIKGIFEEDVKWTDFTSYYVDSYKPINSWPHYRNVDSIEKLWNKFSILWQDIENRNFLVSLVHWYAESNSQAGSVEGSIIMAQTALELLYNWWIIENKKLIIGNDSANINASNKVRLILSQLNISHSVPESLANLSEYCNKENIVDGADAIVQIRNAIVHSQMEKRRKLYDISNLTKYEVLQLSIWYIEMSLLRILDFDDKYLNRCSTQLGSFFDEESVPWSVSK